MRIFVTTLLAAMLSSGAAVAGNDEIKSAVSAGPETLSGRAKIVDWDGNILREGTSGWPCLPDNSGTEGTGPW